LIKTLRPLGKPDVVDEVRQHKTVVSAEAMEESRKLPSDEHQTLPGLPTTAHEFAAPAIRQTARRSPRSSGFAWKWGVVATLLVVGAVVAINWFSNEPPSQIPADSVRPIDFPVARNRGESIPSPEDANPTEWIDLMPTISPERDVVEGVWYRDGAGLHVGSSQNARLAIPFRPPREYELEVDFTRHEGMHSVAIHFVAGDGAASFDIDAWGEHYAGIQNIDDQSMQQRSDGLRRVELRPETVYTARVRVMADRVEAYLDNELIDTYRGDGNNLSMLYLWALPEHALGLGAYESEVTFHTIRLRPLN